MADRRQLEQAIEAQEQLRGSVPDEVVDAAVAALRGSIGLLGDGPRGRRRQRAEIASNAIPLMRTRQAPAPNGIQYRSTAPDAARPASEPVGIASSGIAGVNHAGY